MLKQLQDSEVAIGDELLESISSFVVSRLALDNSTYPFVNDFGLFKSYDFPFQIEPGFTALLPIL